MIEHNISVVMASYLTPYKGSSKNRVHSFQRAVDSFLKNNYPNKELLICSDGCELTNSIYYEKYKNNSEIKLITLPKQPMFSGNVREAGLIAASGDVITYLDSDDIIGVNHLESIDKGIFDCDFVYYNDFIKFFHLEHLPTSEREVRLEKGIAGTSCISHKNHSDISWIGCDGYGHDWTFIEKLIHNYPNHKKINGCKYLVCHIPNSFAS